MEAQQLQAALHNQRLPGQLLLQMHNELVLEVELDAMESTQDLVVKTIENIVTLNVPLVAEKDAGAKWMEAK